MVSGPLGVAMAPLAPLDLPMLLERGVDKGRATGATPVAPPDVDVAPPCATQFTLYEMEF